MRWLTSAMLCASLLMTSGCGLPRLFVKDRKVVVHEPGPLQLGLATALTVAGTAVVVNASQSQGESQAVGYGIGTLLIIPGLSIFIEYINAKLWQRVGLGKLESESSPEDKASTSAGHREAELAKARQAEAEGRWANAWGAYRRAKDLGPPSQFIDDKLQEMEGKLTAPTKP